MSTHAPTAMGGRSLEPGTVLANLRVSENVHILRVAAPYGFDFRPGQYLKLAVGAGRNPYSIASAPSDPDLEFCVERRPTGSVSRALAGLVPGARIDMDERARGRFNLVESALLHLMVATVTGISPFRSMLREVSLRGSWPGRFVVLHGASFADELPYRLELEDLARSVPDRLSYLPTVSRPADVRNREWRGGTGRVADLAPDVVEQLCRNGEIPQVYACGHPEMVSAVRDIMKSRGIPVVTEAFS